MEEETTMSLQEPVNNQPATAKRPTTRVNLGDRYRKIGISAVAAAVRYQGTSQQSASGPSDDSRPEQAPQRG